MQREECGNLSSPFRNFFRMYLQWLEPDKGGEGRAVVREGNAEMWALLEGCHGCRQLSVLHSQVVTHEGHSQHNFTKE